MSGTIYAFALGKFTQNVLYHLTEGIASVATVGMALESAKDLQEGARKY